MLLDCVRPIEVSVTNDENLPNWETPGLYQVGVGIHRVPLPLPIDALRAVNAYVIEDGDALVLIDPGQVLSGAREALEFALASISCDLSDVRESLVTHFHRDHFTQAVALRREFGTRVSLGANEAATIRLIQDPSVDTFSQHYELLERCGASELVRDLRVLRSTTDPPRNYYEDPDKWLVEGERLELKSRELIVFATPGHTRGHIVFYDEEASVLFAGDHVLPHITPSIGFENAISDRALFDYLASLQRMLSLPDARLLPAHGPVTTSVHSRVDELLIHHDIRLRAAFKEVAEGEYTAYEVANGLRWSRREDLFSELDPMNQLLAISETKAHLDLLVRRGRLIETLKNGVSNFSLTEGSFSDENH